MCDSYTCTKAVGGDIFVIGSALSVGAWSTDR